MHFVPLRRVSQVPTLDKSEVVVNMSLVTMIVTYGTGSVLVFTSGIEGDHLEVYESPNQIMACIPPQ